MGWLRNRYPIKAIIVHAPHGEFGFAETEIFENVASIKIGPLRKKCQIRSTNGNLVHINDLKPFMSVRVEKPNSAFSRWVRDLFTKKRKSIP